MDEKMKFKFIYLMSLSKFEFFLKVVSLFCKKFYLVVKICLFLFFFDCFFFDLVFLCCCW